MSGWTWQKGSEGWQKRNYIGAPPKEAFMKGVNKKTTDIRHPPKPKKKAPIPKKAPKKKAPKKKAIKHRRTILTPYQGSMTENIHRRTLGS